MTNPFMSLGLAAEDQDQDTLRRLRVDRDNELQRCLEGVNSGTKNVLVYGEKGTGKTYLARLIHMDLRDAPKIFPVMVNLAQLPAYGANPTTSAFPRAVLLQTCVAIWKELLGKRFLDLNRSVALQGKELFEGKASRILKEVYGSLITSSETNQAEWKSTAGASAVVKGEMAATSSRRRERLEVLPFEFFEFAEAIQSEVLRRFGKSRIVAICDEANLLPSAEQQEILERYLELFLTKSIHFVFVAGHLPWEQMPNLPTAFEVSVELRGFPEPRHVQELIDRIAANSNIPIVPEAVGLVWAAYSGHPRKTLSAFSRAYMLAVESGTRSVTKPLMGRAVEEVNREYERWEASFRMQRTPAT